MRSTIRRVICSTCFTLFVSSGSAGGGLDGACVVSRRRVLFSFVVNFSQTPIVCIDTYIPISVCIKELEWGSWQVAVPLVSASVVRIPDGVYFCVTFPFICRSSVKICTRYKMIEVSSEQSSKSFHVYADIASAVAAAASVLLCVLLYCCCCGSSSSAAVSCCCSSSCAGWPKLLPVHVI